MASGIRSLRWRASFTVASVAFVLMYLFASGRIGSHIIQIDYTWGRGLLDSAQVEIDGTVVGVLESITRQRVAGFEVEPGVHVVRILHPECFSKPDTVVLGGDAGRLAVRMADIDEAYNCRVLLR